MFCGSSYANGLDHLPGYKFTPKKIPFLKDYKITEDVVYVEGRETFGIQRRISFKKKKSFLSIHIHVAQNKKVNRSKIINGIILNPNITGASAYNRQDPKKVGIGEALYTRNSAPILDVLYTRVLFSRNNIVVRISDQTKSQRTTNLKPLAEEIDKDISRRIRVSLKKIESCQPIIEDFILAKKAIKAHTTTILTVKVSDPAKLKTSLFFETNGEVIKINKGYTLDSPILLGKHTVNLIVVNENLLYSEKTVSFSVVG